MATATAAATNKFTFRSSHTSVSRAHVNILHWQNIFRWHRFIEPFRVRNNNNFPSNSFHTFESFVVRVAPYSVHTFQIAHS